VYENGWEAKSEDQLIRRIESKIKEFDLKSVVAFMKRVKGKLKSIGADGVFFLFKKMNFYKEINV